MSDILIKGMEMPKSCYACMFFAQTDYWNKEDEADILSYCKRTGEKTWESVNGYLPNCPLVPVPPYGDLIDRAELWVEINKICDRRDAGIITDLTCLQQILSALRHAPTIILAEEGET